MAPDARRAAQAGRDHAAAPAPAVGPASLPAQPGQPIDLALPPEAMGGAATQALLKTQALELIRLVLPQGKAVPPRTVRGELTVHCLEGELVLAFDGAACHLGPGQLVLLPAGTEHAIHAASDAVALLTVQIR